MMCKQQATLGYGSWLGSIVSPENYDEIERWIMRAYVQLMFRACGTDGNKVVTVTRSRSCEVQLTEISADKDELSAPLFHLETISIAGRLCIDRCELREFDEADLITASDFVLRAVRGL